MSDGPADRDATRSGTALVRGVLFLGLWCVLIGSGHLVIGVATAALATAASLRLLPPGPRRLRLGGLPPFALRFARQSVVAGWDVARRAFDPRVPVRPGFVTYRVGFRPGVVRNVFTVITGLVPGTVPAGEDDEAVTYHCLDVEQPVASQLAAEEAALSRLLRHG